MNTPFYTAWARCSCGQLRDVLAHPDGFPVLACGNCELNVQTWLRRLPENASPPKAEPPQPELFG